MSLQEQCLVLLDNFVSAVSVVKRKSSFHRSSATKLVTIAVKTAINMITIQMISSWRMIHLGSGRWGWTDNE